MKLIGIGHYIPSKILTNFDLEKIVDTSDEWITTRTGIKERRISENESLIDMAYKASTEALRMAQTDGDHVDLIILATLTPELSFPASACLLQARLGNTKAFAFDISAACSGFIYSLDIAHSFISSGKAKKVLVVGAEKLSEIVNWQDRNTCVLFGDGAGAVLLSDEGKDKLYISRLLSDGSLWEILYAKKCDYINMKGRELFKIAVRSMEEACREVIETAGITPEDIKLMIPHQANIRIIESLAEKLNFPMEKVYTNIHKYGNTSAASIPLALSEAFQEGRVKEGDIVLFTAMGGGLTWGAVLMEL